jgi:hypothetical protein
MLLSLLNHLQHSVLIIPTSDTVRAPVVVDEEAVRSFSLVTPATSKEVLIAALFNVANPVAAC